MESRLPADPVDAAEWLIGATLSHEGAGGMIVESEACRADDPASQVSELNANRPDVFRLERRHRAD